MLAQAGRNSSVGGKVSVAGGEQQGGGGGGAGMGNKGAASTINRRGRPGQGEGVGEQVQIPEQWQRGPIRC